MPNYSFKNEKTGEVYELNMSYDDKLKYLEENPDVRALLSRPSIGYHMLVRKPDDNFRDVLKNIKSKHQGSTVNTW